MKLKVKLTSDTTTTIKAKKVGPLAVHEAISDPNKITVTHIATGCAVISLSKNVPLKAITPLLKELGRVIGPLTEVASISSTVGQEAMFWLAALRRISVAYEHKANPSVMMPKPKRARQTWKPRVLMDAPIPNELRGERYTEITVKAA